MIFFTPVTPSTKWIVPCGEHFLHVIRCDHASLLAQNCQLCFVIHICYYAQCLSDRTNKIYSIWLPHLKKGFPEFVYFHDHASMWDANAPNHWTEKYMKTHTHTWPCQSLVTILLCFIGKNPIQLLLSFFHSLIFSWSCAFSEWLQCHISRIAYLFIYSALYSTRESLLRWHFCKWYLIVKHRLVFFFWILVRETLDSSCQCHTHQFLSN